MIRFKLKELAEGRISMKQLALAANVDYKTLHWLKTGKQTGISFPVLDRLCRVLDCEPGSFFEWVQEPEKATKQDESV